MLVTRNVKFKAHELPNEKLGGLEAAEFLGVDPVVMFKTFVALHNDDGKAVLALVPANTEVDLKALSSALGTKKMSAATLAQAEQLTGLQAGGISPLALIGKAFSVVIDESALALKVMYLSAGERGLNISMAPDEVIRLTSAKTFPIGREKPA
ncbi:MAG: Cys-tRNA(Pro) deacylase [Chloroflexi bacterium]|nr:Cys-tRNA(Pro) deacylase [Chloroflexota bacterium]